MDTSKEFQACWPFTLRQECPLPNDWSNPRNFSNDAHDAGGKTQCGLTQKEYDVFRHHCGEHVQDVRKVTRDEGENIYYNSYWLPHCDNLPPGLNLSFFDESVNTGPYEAVLILQRALEIPADGHFGPVTERAISLLDTNQKVSIVIRKFAEAREHAYRQMRGFPYFGEDWVRRTWSIAAQSQVMCSKAATT